MTSLRKLSLTFITSILVCSELFQPFAASLKSYKQKCSQDDDCESQYCNQAEKQCDCPSYMDRTKRRMEAQFYDHDLKMCLSRVGQLCTLHAVDDGLTPFVCAPNAACATTSNQVQSREFFGMCSCQNGHQPIDDGKRCISNAELRTGKVSSMDQVRPEGWNRSGGNSFSKSSIYESGVFAFVNVFTTIYCLFPFR